jgi:hypothetical protein
MSDKFADRDYEDLDEQDEPSFQRLRKQSGKPQTIKDSRKQAGKEFGRAINKFHKQRRRFEGPGKP